MEKQEFDALVSKVGAETAQLIKTAVEPMQKQINDFETKFGANPGAITQKDIDVLNQSISTNEKALRDILEKQGGIITEIQNKLNTETDDGDSVVKVLESVKTQIQQVYKAGTGHVEIQLGYKVGKNGKYKMVAKAADVHNTTTTGANASITSDLSDSALLRIGSESDEIMTIKRNTPWILDFVSVGNTTSSVITWFDEVQKQGDFAVTAEGAIKPLVMYTFNRKSADYKKATGRAKITEEFNMDFPRLVSTIRDLMSTDCKNEMNALILSDMIANATAYNNPALAGEIDNADNYAAIGAVAGQLGNAYYTPNVLVLNNNQGIVNASQKGTDGQFINPEALMKEINAAGLNIAKNPDVNFGKFFMADGSVYKVLLRGDLIIRIGYSNDDFDKNQYSLVVEQFFYSFMSDARKAGLVYADFEEVKAAIEKP